ncbi:MAG: PEGA domain-containing protein [Patescibacteria group bacterium]
MKKRTRRIIFWLAVIAFGLASWVVIKYAQGYIFDWNSNAFVRTGAIAVTVNTGASLFVNDTKTGDTSFLGNRAGRDRLAPGTYQIKLVRDGYSGWRKTIEVREGMLTDFPTVLLLPSDEASQPALKAEASVSLAESRTLKNAPPKMVHPEVSIGDFALSGTQLWDMRIASGSIIAKNVLGFTVADNTSRLLWWTRNELWVLWLRNTDYQPFRTEGERQAVTRFSVPIIRAAWFRDYDHIIVDLGHQDYRVIETDARGGLNIIKI